MLGAYSQRNVQVNGLGLLGQLPALWSSLNVNHDFYVLEWVSENPFSNIFSWGCFKGCFTLTFRETTTTQAACRVDHTEAETQHWTPSHSLLSNQCCWAREHKYNEAVQTRVGIGLGPCEDKDESLVEMTQYTEYTEPNYRHCNSGNLLQKAKGVEKGRRWEIAEVIQERNLCVSTFLHRYTLKISNLLKE